MFYIEEFIRSLNSTNKSIYTVKNYRIDLNKFYNYIKNLEKYKNKTDDEILNSITLFDLEGYRDFLNSNNGRRGNGESERTINRRIASLKSYFNYLEYHEIIPRNVAKNLKSLKLPKASPVYLNLNEANNLIISAKKEKSNGRNNDHRRLRNELMIRIYIKYGLRNSELINLTLNDVDLETGKIRIIGKGNKERFIYLSEDEILLYKEYLEVRNLLNVKDNNVFLSNNGNKLDATNVWRIIKECAKNSDISESKKKKITPHKLRHTAATLAIKNGIPLNSVSKLLGHSKTSITTDIYIHTDDEDIINACRQISEKIKI